MTTHLHTPTTRSRPRAAEAVARTGPLLLAVVVSGVLAACSPSDDAASSGSPSSGGTSGSPGPTISAPQSSKGSIPSASTSATASAPGGEDSPDGQAAPQVCSSGQLEAALGEGSGAGAGHVNPVLILTNTGDTPCTVSGFPGVSFVGGGTGAQVGAPAVRDTSGADVAVVTLDPGDAAHSELDITVAANYDPASCEPQDADGLRVYPPDQTEALFVRADGYTACRSDDIELIQVRALEPGQQ